jgi:hypothetical protein
LGSPGRRPWARPARSAALAVGIVVVLLGVAARPAAAATYPPLPGGIGNDRFILNNLSAPSIGPGGSGRIDFTVTAPTTPAATLTSVVVTCVVYAFNGYPGNGASSLPVADAPVLSTATLSGENVSVLLGNVTSGDSIGGSVGVATSSATPAGTYAVRTAVSFSESGTSYRLESRGWFSATVWEKATELPNGTATLNLSVLGVSGVVPETAILVSPSGWSVALPVVAAVGLALVGAAAWVYFRRSPGSSSGTG